MKRWTWPDELYDVTVIVIKGDGDEARAWLDKQFKDITDAEVGRFTGAKTLWIERPRGVALVQWFPQWFNVANAHHLGVLAHECFHAAEFVLRERGFQLTDASDEAYAYYIAWMFRNVYRRLRGRSSS